MLTKAALGRILERLNDAEMDNEAVALQSFYDDVLESLALAAVALEPLNMDNGLGAKWMTKELRAATSAAVLAIRNTMGVRGSASEVTG